MDKQSNEKKTQTADELWGCKMWSFLKEQLETLQLISYNYICNMHPTNFANSLKKL